MLAAADVAIKLGTQAPANSSWHKALLDMGAAWSEGHREARHADGLSGRPRRGRSDDDPEDAARRRSLQADLLTAGGLAEIDEAFNVFAMPFFFETDDEELAVQQKLSRCSSRRCRRRASTCSPGAPAAGSSSSRRSRCERSPTSRRRSSSRARATTGWCSGTRATASTPVALLIADIPPQLKLPTGHDRHGAEPAVPRADDADFPRREVHARSPHRAARRRADRLERGLEQDLAGGSAKRSPPPRRRSRSASAPRRRSRTPTRSRR